jgi:L-ribulose-5-phosphate 3-epimerase
MSDDLRIQTRIGIPTASRPPAGYRRSEPQLDDLRAAFMAAVRPDRGGWPAEAAADPLRVAAAFASAGRVCGRAPLTIAGWTCDDAARVLLLDAAVARSDGGPSAVDASGLLFDLYTHGDAAERRAVLRALPYLPDVDAESVRALVEDALRTNDHGLIVAAMGPCARALDAAAWRHGVLKCVFVGLPPVRTVTDLDERADDELARMLRDFAGERTAAGRPVPADVTAILTRFAA